MAGAQAFRQVDDEQVHLAAGDERSGQRPALVDILRPADEQPAQVNAARLGLQRIEDPAQVEKADDRAACLGLGQAMQRESGLAARTCASKRGAHAARQPASAEQRIQPGKAGGHDLVAVVVYAGRRRGWGINRRNAEADLDRRASPTRLEPGKGRAERWFCGHQPMIEQMF